MNACSSVDEGIQVFWVETETFERVWGSTGGTLVGLRVRVRWWTKGLEANSVTQPHVLHISVRVNEETGQFHACWHGLR